MSAAWWMRAGSHDHCHDVSCHASTMCTPKLAIAETVGYLSLSLVCCTWLDSGARLEAISARVEPVSLSDTGESLSKFSLTCG